MTGGSESRRQKKQAVQLYNIAARCETAVIGKKSMRCRDTEANGRDARAVSFVRSGDRGHRN